MNMKMTFPKIQDPPECKYNLDEVKQLQGQDPHFLKIIVNVNPTVIMIKPLII